MRRLFSIFNAFDIMARTAKMYKAMTGFISKRTQAALAKYSKAMFVKCEVCGRYHGVTLIKVNNDVYRCVEHVTPQQWKQRQSVTKAHKRNKVA